MDEPAGATDLESNMETNSSRATITPAQIMALFIQGLPCGSLSSFIFTLFTVDPKIGVHGQITIFVQPFGRASASSPPRGSRFHRPDLTALQYQTAHCILDRTSHRLNY